MSQAPRFARQDKLVALLKGGKKLTLSEIVARTGMGASSASSCVLGLVARGEVCVVDPLKLRFRDYMLTPLGETRACGPALLVAAAGEIVGPVYYRGLRSWGGRRS